MNGKKHYLLLWLDTKGVIQCIGVDHRCSRQPVSGTHFAHLMLPDARCLK
jgi:hypothetical protein